MTRSTYSIYAGCQREVARIEDARAAAGWEYDPEYGWANADGITESEWLSMGNEMPEDIELAKQLGL